MELDCHHRFASELKTLRSVPKERRGFGRKTRCNDSFPRTARRIHHCLHRLLNQRISIFTALPLRSLDKLSLQNKLQEIGEMEGATTLPERS